VTLLKKISVNIPEFSAKCWPLRSRWYQSIPRVPSSGLEPETSPLPRESKVFQNYWYNWSLGVNITKR
jgi:hypothetical protein